MDDDKERKSWREIDQAKDRSKHRSERPETKGGKDLSTTHAYRAFKRKAEQVFSGQEALPEAWAKKLGPSKGPSLKARQSALKTLMVTPTAELAAALQSFEAEHGFPRSEEALGRLLELKATADLVRVLDAIVEEAEAANVAHPGRLITRLQTLRLMHESPKMQARIDACVAALRR